jgi:hypothetical protein
LFGCTLFVGIAVVSGCDLADGLRDVGGSLTNPDAALLDKPGRKLASGLFRNLLIDGSIDEGGHVIALREKKDGQDLAIIPYLKGSPCFVDPAVRVDRLSSRIDVELPGILSVQLDEDKNGRGEVQFIDFDCKEVFDGFEGSGLPQVAFPASAPRGLLGVTGSGELYLVEPAKQRSVFIAQGAAQARSFNDRLWTIEDGKLVIRDKDLDEVDQVGSSVVGYALGSGSFLNVALMDADGLSFWSEDDGLMHISETACSPTPWGYDAMAFFDPCEERTLNVVTRGSKIGSDQDYVQLVGPSNIASLDQFTPPEWGYGTAPSYLGFLVGDPGASRGELVLARIDSEAEFKEGETIELHLTPMSEGGTSLRGGEIYLDWDGTAGDLAMFLRDDDDEIVDLLPIADRVGQIPGLSPFARNGLLVDYDGLVGELRFYQADGSGSDTKISSTKIAQGVPSQPQHIEPESGRIAFVGDSSDGRSGTLYLGDKSGENPTKLEALDDDVLVDTARFLEQPRGLAYLVRAPGDTKAQLKVRLLDSAITMTVHGNVHEYRTVPWPAAGILYAVPNGVDQGMWFSKAR